MNKQQNRMLADALTEGMIVLPGIYDDILNSTRFQGEGMEEPNFSKEDYHEYIRWINGNGDLPKGINGLKKATLIGANKVFGVLRSLSRRAIGDLISKYGSHAYSETFDDREIQRSIDLRLGDDSSIIVDHVEDLDHYSYRNLYLGFPGQDTLVVRAVHTGGLGSLTALNTGKIRTIRLTEGGLSEILDTFYRLHDDVNKGAVRFNVNLPYDAKVTIS